MKKKIKVEVDGEYEIIFRMSYIHPKTGKLIKAKPGHPFPMRVPKRASEK